MKLDIKELEVVLKDTMSSKLKLFHKLIFDEDGDRNNRKRLLEFTGLHFEIESDEFKQKINEIKTKFSVSELFTICNLILIMKAQLMKLLLELFLVYVILVF